MTIKTQLSDSLKETIGYEDLLAMGTMAEAKRHGKVRSEGRAYRVRDGDVIEILFSR